MVLGTRRTSQRQGRAGPALAIAALGSQPIPFGRLFVIKTRFEACLVIYALAIGASERGGKYLEHLPTVKGVVWPAHSAQLLFFACMGAVFLAGARIFDALPDSVLVPVAQAMIQSSVPRATTPFRVVTALTL